MARRIKNKQEAYAAIAKSIGESKQKILFWQSVVKEARAEIKKHRFHIQKMEILRRDVDAAIDTSNK
jgi:methionine salvage enolase-phosphatase E1